MLVSELIEHLKDFPDYEVACTLVADKEELTGEVKITVFPKDNFVLLIQK